MKVKLGIVLLVVLIGCSSNDNPNIEHPTIENISSENERHQTIQAKDITPISSDPAGDISLLNFDSLQETASIGKLYGAEEEMFGQIEDIVVDKFNRISLTPENNLSGSLAVKEAILGI